MIFQFVKTNIGSKKVKNFLTIFAIMISVMLMICIQNIAAQLNSNVIDNISEYDLIVGRNGSSTGLVMSTVFYYGVPEGNIDISYLESLQNNKYVEKAVPLGMGDSYGGYKIIGTSSLFFDNENYVLQEGKLIEEEGEVVLGAIVAKKTGLKVGDTFKSQHGLTEAESTITSHHDENFEYTVVGILKATNTPNDTVLFTTIETLWHTHRLDEHSSENHDSENHNSENYNSENHDSENYDLENHDLEEQDLDADTSNENNLETEMINPISSSEENEKVENKSHGVTNSSEEETSTSLLTAVLIRSRGLAEQNLLYQELKRDEKIQVIIPTETLRGLLNSFDIGEVVITLIASVSVILSIIMLFITMLTSSMERRKDISILRALGAKRSVVFRIILIEILVIACVGVLLGFLFAHLGIAILGNYTATYYGLNMSAWIIQPKEWFVMLITVGLSLIAGMIPAWMVYRTDATKYLK